MRKAAGYLVRIISLEGREVVRRFDDEADALGYVIVASKRFDVLTIALGCDFATSQSVAHGGSPI